MIKSIAKVFEFKEGSISPRTLRIILVLMLVSLPVWPLLMMQHYDLIPNGWVGALAAVTILIGAISMFGFICTRFVNRFFFPDKYLDEWERTIKHRSMSFAYMVLVWVVSPIVVALIFYTDFNLSLTGKEFSLWIVGLLLMLLYLQSFHALWQVKPMDEDDLG